MIRTCNYDKIDVITAKQTMECMHTNTVLQTKGKIHAPNKHIKLSYM